MPLENCSLSDSNHIDRLLGNEANRDTWIEPSAFLFQVITVGATNIKDGRPDWSNYGMCVDIFAPGHGVTTAARTTSNSDPDYTVSYGTSIAAGFVAGKLNSLRFDFYNFYYFEE